MGTQQSKVEEAEKPEDDRKSVAIEDDDEPDDW